MKIPQTPPGAAATPELVQDQIPTILEVSRESAHDGKYLHWDKLRHLKPPKGLSHEQWWLALKLARAGLMKGLPLKDADGNSFSFGLPDPAPEQLHHIDQDAGGRIEMAEPEIANPSTRDRYIVRSLVEEAITSSQLEGAATTRLVAKEMIRSGRAPKDISERMILNNYAAMRDISKLKDKPLTPELIFSLHKTLTDGTLDNPTATGRLRTKDEDVQVVDPYNVILHDPPPADQLESRLKSLCDFANEESPGFFIHPVIRSIILHFWLAYDHPFVDGNGRCARGLFYWSMLKHGYWLCEFISISEIIRKAPVKYGRSFLYTETDSNDMTYFILYHLDLIRKATTQLHEYIDNKIKETARTERLIRTSRHLNHRQMALLSHALRHPDMEYTIQSHKVSHGVVYQTARDDLMDLADKSLLTVQKGGRRFWFRPVPDLEDALGQT